MTTIVCLLSWAAVTLAAGPLTPWLTEIVAHTEQTLGLTVVPSPDRTRASRTRASESPWN